ncbi:MAG: Mini-ribonuclease 3 [Lachnospiraceae bacterium]
MEKGIEKKICETFGIEEKPLNQYSPLVLAYIGDAIYELVIRSYMVSQGNTQVSKLHRKTSQLVKAHAQSELIEILMPALTEEEKQVYKRGRNAKSPTMAKNATMADYRRATGFEALMGYLYMKNDFERILELVHMALKDYEIEREPKCDTRN